MNIKELHIEQEKNLIKLFLQKYELNYDNNITATFYLENNNGDIIGTISAYKNIIKCLAVDENYQSENLASTLISTIINYFYQNKIYHYMVYTKPKYEKLFINLSFKKIINTENVCILEAGINLIDEQISLLRKQIESKFNINIYNENISAIVCNCNPMTIGHLSLIEKASENSNYVIVFVLETEESMFTFKERMSLLYIGTLHLSNVIILPATDYIISLLTFPTYFLKEESAYNKEWMTTDALIFKEYFMNKLNIKKRYVGKETDSVMKLYNQTLKDILKDKLIEIERLNNISASQVRKLILENKVDEALELIPKSCQSIFYIMAKDKINGK